MRQSAGSVEGIRNICWLSCLYPVAFFLMFPSTWFLSLVLPFNQHSMHHRMDPLCLIAWVLVLLVVVIGALWFPCLIASICFLILGLAGRVIAGDRKVVLAVVVPLLL